MHTLRSDSPTLKHDLRENYDALAPRYDWMEALPEVLGLSRLRRALLRQAQGDVLEVAVGTGKNLRHYPPGCRLTGVDLSPAMLALARRRATRLGLAAEFRPMDAERLGFPAATFDTVVSTLSTCTFPDPVAALLEMARVLRPSGRILLLEHGRSSSPWLGRWQDRRAARHFALLGCAWNRDPAALLAAAGLRAESARRVFFGIFHAFVALPTAFAQQNYRV
jgi:ubiquinone/menaquinone biosynthesis C-methylase UbiE